MGAQSGRATSHLVTLSPCHLVIKPINGVVVMYKLLLCWRYLKTRYLALVCVVSVMLGVATLIVVNSVMNGFTTKLRDRLHCLLSDIVIESHGLEGFHNPQAKMDKIKADPFLGPRVAAMSATLETFALLEYRYPSGDMYTRPVRLIGIDPGTRSDLGGFRDFLMNEDRKKNPTFELPADIKRRLEDDEKWLQWKAQQEREDLNRLELNPESPPPPMPTEPVVELPKGAVVGNLIASFRRTNPDTKKLEEVFLLRPGDRIYVTTVTAASGQKMKPVFSSFVVVDFFKSEMNEYDGNFIFVPLDYLQHIRTMPDRVTSIQIKINDYREAQACVEALERLFPTEPLKIETWEQKQGPLLKAIDVEKGILNVLLFLIIAVAGFGILSIFSMIVTEKTRDIGILKALGASNGGVMKIFLGYGLLLGVVGATLGTALGIWLTNHINDVEAFLSKITGSKMFSGDIYYFTEIPTDIQTGMLLSVNLGAIAIAVIFSILPALRAAWLHPVRALRYE
jgi:lipoprotein-releasing system permease protein